MIKPFVTQVGIPSKNLCRKVYKQFNIHVNFVTISQSLLLASSLQIFSNLGTAVLLKQTLDVERNVNWKTTDKTVSILLKKGLKKTLENSKTNKLKQKRQTKQFKAIMLNLGTSRHTCFCCFNLTFYKLKQKQVLHSKKHLLQPDSFAKRDRRYWWKTSTKACKRWGTNRWSTKNV